MKRWICVFLGITLLSGGIPVTAQADSGQDAVPVSTQEEAPEAPLTGEGKEEEAPVPEAMAGQGTGYEDETGREPVQEDETGTENPGENIQGESEEENGKTAQGTWENVPAAEENTDPDIPQDPGQPRPLQETSVKISFDNNDALNGFYFNAGRVMSVEITDSRAFEESLVLVKASVNGKAGDYGLSAIRENMAEGITLAGEPETDGKTTVFSLCFGGNLDTAEYSFEVQVSYDGVEANAEGCAAADRFVVDKTAPVFEASFTDGKGEVFVPAAEEEAPLYVTGPVEALLSVKETYFRPEDFRLEIRALDSEGTDNGAYPEESSAAPSSSEWTEKDGVRIFKMDPFEKDANYSFFVTCSDLAGNKAAVSGPCFFTIDTLPPEGTITVTSGDGTGEFSGYSENVRFMFMDNEPIAVARDVRDATSGVASVDFLRYVPAPSERGTFSGLSLEELERAGWQEWEDTVTVAPDSQAVIYARLRDRAGNISYINTDGAMIADNTSPDSIGITVDAKAGPGGIYNSDIPVRVSVEDILTGGTYSGLKEVTIEVLRDGTVTQRQAWSFEPKEDRRKTFSTDFTVDSSKNNSNSVTVRVMADDYAGNTARSERKVSIDITKPRIEVSYDLNEPVNGKYYNAVRTATVRVYERNFDPSGVRFRLSGKPVISGWSTGPGAGSSDETVSTCSIVYGEDGDYSFGMSVTDMAGNSASYSGTDVFTIDRTDPVIKVSFDVNEGLGRFFNRQRTATVTVMDRNFDETAFESSITAFLDGLRIVSPRFQGWTHDGIGHYGEIVFSGDGDYSFVLNAKDLAGNAAASYRQELFTIDRTGPAVEFFDVDDGSANKGETAPGIRFGDRNLKEGSLKLFLRGAVHEEREISVEDLIPEQKGTVKMRDFPHIITEDDVYTLTASVTDLAGNKTRKELSFSVNRFGSNYYFSEATAVYLERQFHKNARSITVFEVNVDDLKESGVTVYRDGAVLQLPGTAVRIEDVSGGNSWKKYRYTVDTSVFDREGFYEILFYSTDEAGNKQDNKVKGAPVSFTIDRTPPGAVITGAENGGIYNEASRELVILVSDNFAMGKLKVFLNGEAVREHGEEEILASEGRISLTVPESDRWQEITLEYEDAAGNRGSTDPFRIFVNTDWVTRMVQKGVLKYLAAALSVTAVLLAVFVRRKKGEKEE